MDRTQSNSLRVVSINTNSLRNFQFQRSMARRVSFADDRTVHKANTQLRNVSSGRKHILSSCMKVKSHAVSENIESNRMTERKQENVVQALSAEKKALEAMNAARNMQSDIRSKSSSKLSRGSEDKKPGTTAGNQNNDDIRNHRQFFVPELTKHDDILAIPKTWISEIFHVHLL